MANQVHASDDDLELYSLGRLDEPELGNVEEHLLICAECQGRLERQDEFTNAARSALERLQVESTAIPAGSRWGWRSFTLAGALAVAAAVLVMFAVHPQEAQDVQLVAHRGAPDTATAEAKSGAPVRLRVAPADLPPATAYLFEITDPNGRTAWTGRAETQSGTLNATAPKLSAGNYWVRLYAETGTRELLNEFALVVR